MNLNKVLLIGRATAVPELRTTPTGQSVSTFSIATNRTWTDKNNMRKEETEFHNVVVWGRQAEIASQFLAKGQVVFVEGRMQTRSWQDKQGATRKTTEVICERFQFGQKAMGGAGVQSTASGAVADAASGGASASDAAGGGGAGTPAGNTSGAAGDAGSEVGVAGASPSTPANDMPSLEDLPTIDLEEDLKEEIKPEDIPF